MNSELEAVLTKIRDADLPTFIDTPIDSAFVRGPAFGTSLLHVVAIWGDVDAARILLDAGVEIDLPGEHGFTALHEAIQQGHPEMVRLLLKRGADAAKPQDWGNNALQLAEISGRPEIVELLRGA